MTARAAGGTITAGRPNEVLSMSETWVITGASRGIGAATATLAAARGNPVIVNYARDEAAARRVVDDITAAGGRAAAVQADVSREDDVARLFRSADETFGPLAVLVNNAGIVDRKARVDEIDGARLQRMFSINVTGSFLCASQAVRRMSTAAGGAGGSIVNVSSAAARLGSPGEYVDYAASKAAIDTFTVGLAREVALEGIRVNAVRPGIITTDIHASGGDPGRAGRLAPLVPMQRPGSAVEVANAIVWLASAGASYCTGAILDVSGGR
jgi:NAD(P)-dependent dehydrogenase (short-subunit alcohol dehydrogenase family)